MKSTEKVGHPVLIGSVLILILNDWYLKEAFHNDLTGKLSDFAGLMAFPFLMSALCPRHPQKIHLATAVLFIAWKSSYAEPLIVLSNAVGFPVERTVDATDLVALVSVAVSYRLTKQECRYRLTPALTRVVAGISALAFMATTMPPRRLVKYEAINKVYAFNFSRRDLISKLNMLQLKEMSRLNALSGKIDFETDTDVFHYRGQPDTLAMLLDYHRLKDFDTITYQRGYRPPWAEILIAGDENRSTLTLVHAYRFVLQRKDKDYREQVIRTFEKQVIKKIKRRP